MAGTLSLWLKNKAQAALQNGEADLDNEADTSASVNESTETGESSTDSARLIQEVLKAPTPTDIAKDIWIVMCCLTGNEYEFSRSFLLYARWS